jgi:lipoprotein-anchoring transpeptidase ErfK/SrfK
MSEASMNTGRKTALTLLTALILMGSLAHAQISLGAADDLMTPEEIAHEEAGQHVDLGDPDMGTATCPIRVQIIVNKAKSQAPSASSLLNTKPETDTSQTLQVYVDCHLKYNWPVSTGRERLETSKSGRTYVTSTDVGVYRIDSMTTMYHSHTWNAPMPYAIFFLPGTAIHATEPGNYRRLGSRASGGCVRLDERNAVRLYTLVKSVGAQNVLITINDGESMRF